MAPWIAVAAICAAALGATSARATDSIANSINDRPIAPPSATMLEASDAAQMAADRPIAAPTNSLFGDATRTIVALGGVLALVFVLRYIMKRIGDPLAARRPSGVVQVLSRFPFGKGQQVVLLSVGTRILCVHHGATQTRTLCEISDVDEIAALRTRIEAGTAGRDVFERELTRSLERDESIARPVATPITRTPSHMKGAEMKRAITETIDLTKSARSQRPGSFMDRLRGGRA
ncbi:MAG: flagellar biosynthetic protein FliO [Phycisphaerae bacterium]|nr:flagellar biosynthetic protein FliO [Phycisphaerae bacterium]